MPDTVDRHFGGSLIYRSAQRNSLLDDLPVDLVGQIGVTGLLGVQYYFNHFHMWEGPVAEGTAGGWLLSGVTGAATIVKNAVRGGEIVLTADATGNCDPTLQLGNTTANMPFRYSVGKRLWVAARLKMGTVTSTEAFFGLGTADTEPTVTNTLPADGIFFEKAAAATTWDFHARQDGTSTERTGIGSTLVDDTHSIVGFQVDVQGNILPFHVNVLTGLTASRINVGDANIPDAAGDTLTFMVALRGASQTITLDWLLLAQEM